MFQPQQPRDEYASRYSGSPAGRILGLVMAAFGALMVWAVLLPHDWSKPGPMRIPGAVFGAGFVLFGVIGILESFTAYELTPDGVTRRAWIGSASIRWSDVVHYEATGQKDSSYVLKGSAGKSLQIGVSYLKAADRAALLGELESYLQPVRERQRSELTLPGKCYPVGRGIGWVGVIFLFLGGINFALPFIAGGSEGRQRPDMVPLAAYGLVMAVPGLLAALAGFSSRLVVTNYSIRRSNLFRTVEIPFASITSVGLRKWRTQNGQEMEATVVEGAGRRIQFTSVMTDYNLVREFLLRERGDKEEGGGASAVTFQREQARTVVVIVTICCVCLAGLGGFFINDGAARLARQRLLDEHGVTAVGKITGGYVSHGKSASYYLYYRFQAGGRPIDGVSPVALDDFQRARRGQGISVTYNPDNPHMCRAAQSIGRSNGRSRVVFGLGVIGIGLFSLIAVLVRSRKLLAGPLRPPSPS